MTVATGSTATVGVPTTSDALPDLPSAVAVIVTVPAFSVLTLPVPSTDATVGSETVQTMERPVSTVPFASLSVALACVDWPARSDGALSVTVTDATGTVVVEPDDAVTVTGTTILRPSAFTLISADPAAMVVTTPASSTFATSALELLHETLRPVTGLPLTSYVVAVSCAEMPRASTRLDGCTNTLATGLDSTRTPVLPTLLSTRSSRLALPIDRPVTVASPVSGAMSGAVDTHSTRCLARSTVLPSVSRTRNGILTDCVRLMAIESASKTTSRIPAFTSMTAASVKPRDATVIVVFPVFSPNNTPDCVTKATLVSELVQVIAGAMVPGAGGRIALSWSD